jgi:hypothetical protein
MQHLRETRVGLDVLAAVLAVLLLGLAQEARADVIIDFENNPSLPQQPSDFATAGAMQTYTTPGVYSISGGVVLGNPTFLPAFAGNGGSFGSAPNLYGTTDIADPSLQSTITLSLPAAANTTKVDLVLFNGQASQEDYTITTFINGIPFPTPITLTASSDASGSATNFSVTSFAGPITEVDTTTPNAGTNGWDFFVDTIKLTQRPAVVPEPSSLALLLGLGTATLTAWRWRRRTGRSRS